MAVTTSTRIGVIRWGGGSDEFTRAQLDASHAAIEAKAAGFTKSAGAPPTMPDVAYDRCFYLNTTTGVLYYSNGATWKEINSFAAPAPVVPGSSAVVGNSPSSANAFHVHETPPWGVVGEMAVISTTASEGNLAKFARINHSHILGVGSVIAGTIATGGVSTSSQIANNTIVSTHFTAGAVNAAAIAADQRMPVGAVIEYTGIAAPAGWDFCDGGDLPTAGQAGLFGVIGYKYGGSGAVFKKPNFIDRVPRGASNPLSAAALGVSGGADSVAVVLPQHSHTVASIGVAANGSHAHNWYGTNVAVTIDHTHAGYTGTDSPDHAHHSGGSGFVMQSSGGGSQAFQLIPGPNVVSTVWQTAGITANHAHGVQTYGMQSNATHNHSVSGTIDTQGSHSHSLSGTTDNAGTGGAAVDIRNKFLTINYIIKL